MELLGHSGGLWSYSLTEGLPIFMTIATAINAAAVYAVASIAGVDLSRSTAGKAEDPSSGRAGSGRRRAPPPAF
jgi:hypothetical protein